MAVLSIYSLDYEPVNIRMHCTTLVEQMKRLTAVAKEPETVAFLSELTPAVFFDIGCNTGAYALIASSLSHEVYAFEPPGPTFDRLEQNIDLNDDLRVMAYDVLLGSANVPVVFSYSSLDPGAALHRINGESVHSTVLNMETLDSYVLDHNLPFPSYMKIDTDGSELSVLKGAAKTLEGVSDLQVEIDDEGEGDLVQLFLQHAGFYVRKRTRHGSTSISNVWFSRPE